jgi:tetratricopeptide (TPR) repeat protein/tRNA A-37 threonylcarbamoyl transferase component Bud32
VTDVEPRSISHFDILGELAAGGMGVVYRARDRVLQRDVALKLIRLERAGDAEARRRFLREARAAAVLNHTGIAAVYEAGEARVEGLGEEPQLYLAEELVEGETLAARVRRGPLPVEEAMRLGIQLGEALGAAHDRGIVHRDVKPSNLMVTPAGALKILDFGIAKHGVWSSDLPASGVSAETASRTMPGVLVGTPAYMAPEQIAGVLYELLTGQPPFAGADMVEVLRRSLTETPRPLGELRPEVPAQVGAVVARALARDPGQRYSSGGDLARALREVETRPETERGRAPLTRAGGVRRVAAGAAVVAVVVVGAWFALARFTRPVLAFKERDFVVVADVVNGTGEPVFDLALKSALETDLRQSRYVNVADASQVQNALRFSRLAPDARLDTETGRNICRRVGAQALLVPRILRAGQAYQLQVTLVEPSTGRAVDEVRVTARGREEVLLSSIDKLTNQLRGRLGESLASVARTDPPFAQYTTSSLEALQLLGLGAKARDASDLAKAERYFREALQRDPRFAMARGSLGLILVQFLDRQEEGRKMLAQALQEEGKVSEREYLSLRAVNKQFVTKDLQGALDDYRFISELYPDLMPPYNNAGRILQQLGRFRDAAAMFERAHKTDPRSAVPLWNLWSLSLGGLKDPARAEQVSRTLGSLLPGHAFATHALAWSFVAERRFAEAEDGMRATLKLDPIHQSALPNLGHLLYRRGAPKEAAAIYREVIKEAREGRLKTGIEHAELSLGLALAAAGETAEARRTLVEAADRIRAHARNKPLPPDDEAMIATMLAGAGRKDEARALAESAGRHAAGSIDVNYELARAWAVMGDRARAIRYLEGAFAAGYDDCYLIVVDPSLASLQDDPAIEKLAPRRAEAGQ